MPISGSRCRKGDRVHLVTFLAEREAAPLLFGQIMYEFFQSGGSDVANMKEIAGKFILSAVADSFRISS
jgi:hypothetical protein